MAYIFHEDKLPRLRSVVPGRERVFFVDKELAKTDDMLAGIMRYKKGTASPYHLHENCEHFYFIFEGRGTVEAPDGSHPVKPGTMVFIPAGAEHRLKADQEEDLFYFEFQAPNRFKTTILDGDETNLKWEKIGGGLWVQS
jgi:mannose-6-phosphate isomerase-like protein (cupin superfamily)